MKRHRRRSPRRRKRLKGQGNAIADQLVNLATKNLVDTATVGINSGFKSAQNKLKKLFKGKKKKNKKQSRGAKPPVNTTTTYRRISSTPTVLLPG